MCAESSTIENWIRCKYEKKNYAPKGTPEPWELCAQGGLGRRGVGSGADLRCLYTAEVACLRVAGRDPREAIPPQTPKSHSKKSQK